MEAGEQQTHSADPAIKHVPTASAQPAQSSLSWREQSQSRHHEYQSLLEQKIDLEKCEGQTLTHLAAMRGKVPALRMWLAAKPDDMDSVDLKWRTPLCLAVQSGEIEALQVLLNFKANMHKAKANGMRPLAVAASLGHDKVLEMLIDAKANVNQSDHSGCSPTYVAAWHNHSCCLKVLLGAQADADQSAMDGTTPLHIAAQEGHMDVLEILVKWGADVNHPNNDDVTCLGYASWWCRFSAVEFLIGANADVNKGVAPVHIAAENDQVDVIDVLTEVKADLNQACANGRTASHIAVQQGNAKFLKKLILAKADVHKSTCFGTPLALAASEGQVDALRALVAAKGNMNVGVDEDTLPLSSAIKRGRRDSLGVLIAAKANINHICNDGTTPASVSIESNNVELVKMLISGKLDLKATTSSGWSLPYHAAYSGSADVLKQLVSAKADVNQGAKDGTPSVSLAAINGRLESLKLLIKAKANVNKPCPNGIVPLYAAAENCHIDIFKTLIAAKAEVNRSAKNGRSLVSLAAHLCIKSQIEPLRILIAAKADIHSGGDLGVSPLHIAAEAGSLEALEMLVAAKANVNAMSKEGITPMYAAASQGQADSVKVLLAAKADANKESKDGNSPISIITTLLVAVVEDTNKEQCDERLLVYHSAQESLKDSLLTLIAAKADVHKDSEVIKSTIHCAVENGQVEEAQASALEALFASNVELSERTFVASAPLGSPRPEPKKLSERTFDGVVASAPLGSPRPKPKKLSERTFVASAPPGSPRPEPKGEAHVPVLVLDKLSNDRGSQICNKIVQQGYSSHVTSPVSSKDRGSQDRQGPNKQKQDDRGAVLSSGSSRDEHIVKSSPLLSPSNNSCNVSTAADADGDVEENIVHDLPRPESDAEFAPLLGKTVHLQGKADMARGPSRGSDGDLSIDVDLDLEELESECPQTETTVDDSITDELPEVANLKEHIDKEEFYKDSKVDEDIDEEIEATPRSEISSESNSA